MKNKITPRINILKTTSGIRWGAHLKFLLIVYKGYIRSLFEWGCQVFHPVDNKLQQKADKLQYAALRIVPRLMRTSTNVILDLNGEQPLTTLWQFLLDKYICRTTARQSHPLNQILNSINQLPEEIMQTRSSIVNILKTSNYKSNNSSFLATSTIHIPSASFIPKQTQKQEN